MSQEATFTAACQCLSEFMDKAGEQYAQSRNYDLGPGKQSNVSHLSAYLSRRIILPEEVISRVSSYHGATTASKFNQEIYWQTYWRGWLTMRPQVWEDAQSLKQCHSSTYVDAINGNTGIDAFDAWVDELKNTAYLHNHSRMWFASIWIHTLKLDWRLGAKFFLDYLSDFDSASNTLGWRWVAGIHTKGKHYLASADNIRKFTKGRFNPRGLAKEPAKVLDEVSCDITAPIIEMAVPNQIDLKGFSWVLFTDDCSVQRLITLDNHKVLIIDPSLIRSPLSQKAANFDKSTIAYLRQQIPGADVLSNLDNFDAWLETHKPAGLIWVQATTGVYQDFANKLRKRVPSKIEIKSFRRAWDDKYFRLATKGFFNFKKSAGIP
ncbi:MAG: DNA photolyase FAD-binding protein [Oligoflexales bacterium]|nr:DNA photolyase FAD-binding protein [Oligoflexales bacterium]